MRQNDSVVSLDDRRRQRRAEASGKEQLNWWEKADAFMVVAQTWGDHLTANECLLVYWLITATVCWKNRRRRFTKRQIEHGITDRSGKRHMCGCKLSRASIVRSLASLEAKGLIERTSDDAGLEITVRFDWEPGRGAAHTEPGGGSDGAGGRLTVSPPTRARVLRISGSESKVENLIPSGSSDPSENPPCPLERENAEEIEQEGEGGVSRRSNEEILAAASANAAARASKRSGTPKSWEDIWRRAYAESAPPHRGRLPGWTARDVGMMKTLRARLFGTDEQGWCAFLAWTGSEWGSLVARLPRDKFLGPPPAQPTVLFFNTWAAVMLEFHHQRDDQRWRQSLPRDREVYERARAGGATEQQATLEMLRAQARAELAGEAAAARRDREAAERQRAAMRRETARVIATVATSAKQSTDQPREEDERPFNADNFPDTFPEIEGEP